MCQTTQAFVSSTDFTITTANIIAVVALIFTLFGLYLNYREIKKRNTIQRTIFLKDLLEPFRSDKNIASAFYDIEYFNFSYTSEFHGSEKEVVIDRFLSHCDLVCSFYERGLLYDSDMDHFSYYLTRVSHNSDVGKYFNFLEDWSSNIGVEANFAALRRYLKSIK